MNPSLDPAPPDHWSLRREKTYEVIFGSHTFWGRFFDVALIVAILGSVTAIMLESVASIEASYGPLLTAVEWGFTILFTIEYALRLWCVRRTMGYATSFFGVIDLLAILPTYISVLIPGGQVLTVVRILRVLRVFRILKLVQYVGEAHHLMHALRRSRFKITVFLIAVLTLTVLVGSLMYLIEGADAGFTSIPRSVYWAVVTLTTVGFGDITPDTPLGQALASVVMIMGYGIIAVPTGIITAELAQGSPWMRSSRACPECARQGHDPRASHCKWCGEPLGDAGSQEDGPQPPRTP